MLFQLREYSKSKTLVAIAEVYTSVATSDSATEKVSILASLIDVLLSNGKESPTRSTFLVYTYVATTLYLVVLHLK